MLCWVDGSAFDPLSQEANSFWLVDHSDLVCHRLVFHRNLDGVLEADILYWADGSAFDLLSSEADNLL